ncbi:putative reverse transcriptase domain-containing protein [Tanacetum coccineum]
MDENDPIQCKKCIKELMSSRKRATTNEKRSNLRVSLAELLTYRGIDARVVVEVIDREGIKTSMRSPVEVRVDRVTHPVVADDIPEPAQNGAIEVTYETLGDLVQRFHDHTEEIPVHRVKVIESVQRDQGYRIVATGQQSADMLKRIQELERDNMRHKDMMDVASQRVARSQRRELRVQREMRQIWRFRFYDRMRIARTMPNTRSRASRTHKGINEQIDRQMAGALGARTTTRNLEPLLRDGGGQEKGNVIAAEPTKFQDAIRVANNLMNQKLKRYARSAENKRRLEKNPRDKRGQQPVFKRQNVGGQNVARAYTAGNNEKRGYVGSLPYCNKCKLHHAGPCTVRCGNCNRFGHITRDCTTVVTLNTQRAPVGNQPSIVCYECGRPGHFRKDCPKLRNQNRGNKIGNKNGNKTGNQNVGNEATAKAYAIGGG